MPIPEVESDNYINTTIKKISNFSVIKISRILENIYY